MGSQCSEDRKNSLLLCHSTASHETRSLCGEALILLGSFKNCIHFICFVFSSGPLHQASKKIIRLQNPNWVWRALWG